MIASSNPILDTDSYKLSHHLQYPEGTEEILSYVESRGSAIGLQGTVFFALQMIASQLEQRVTMADVDEAETISDAHIGPGIFPRKGWEHIVNKLDGKIPLEIRAVPEGTWVPNHNVLMTVRSTDPMVPWIVSWFETSLLRIWYPINVATISNSIRQLIYNSLVETSDDPDGGIMFKLHDFGSRGVSSRESAALGGAAHLINFQGSDTIVGIEAANRFYAIDMAGFSIPAAEHSTITTWGPKHEVDAFRNMLKHFAKPGSLLAVVSDSYDLNRAVSEYWGTQLKEEVIASGATVVVRPDSGVPEEIVIQVLDGLADKYGVTVNKKGFKVLNNVRVIQGDGVNEGTIRLILFRMKQHGYSTDNIAFGMGGALLQQHNRDTFKFAYKASLAKINGEYVEVYKDPATDPGKRSKSGLLDLVNKDGVLTTVDRRHDTEKLPSVLETVFYNGEIKKRYTMAEIRARVDERIKAEAVKHNSEEHILA